ncbi:MAG: transposase, partial [Candidatus Woesearchaeota archaeon]
YVLRKKYATMRKFRKEELWAPSYYCGTAGHVSQEQVRRYIMEQTSFHYTKKESTQQTTLCRFAAEAFHRRAEAAASSA